MIGWLRAAADSVADRLHLAPGGVLSEREVVRRYGDPGRKRDVVDEAWRRANIITCRNERGHRLSMPGVPSHYYFDVHRKVEPAMRAAFETARAAAPDHGIVTAGCFVFRHQRHDTKRPLSRHAWAIAVDVNAKLNFSRTFSPGTLPTPWSPAWWKVWPLGLPAPFVRAFESHGFAWGGRWTRGGYVDPMHFEYAGPA